MVKKYITTADFLRAYQNGQIDRWAAMRGIGVDTYRALFEALLESRFNLPRPRLDETNRDLKSGLPILRALLKHTEASSNERGD